MPGQSRDNWEELALLGLQDSSGGGAGSRATEAGLPDYG